MKLLTASVLLGLLLSTSATAVFESCSCNAEDGSCSANIACIGGCIAYCPSGGCRAKCIKTNSFSEEDLYMSLVTVQLNRTTGRQLAGELARITGKEVVFTPSKPEGKFDLDVKESPLWDVLEILAESGKVQIGGEDFAKLQVIRKALVTGEKMSVCIQNASVRQVIGEFAALSGMSIRVASGDSRKLVTLSAKEITMEEVLAKVSEQTGAQIALK